MALRLVGLASRAGIARADLTRADVPDDHHGHGADEPPTAAATAITEWLGR